MYVFLRSLLRRVLTENISFLAGGVAFYGLLAIFPAMAAIVSLFGLLANPYIVHEQMEAVQFLFPPNVFAVLQSQLTSLLNQPSRALSLTVVFSILLTIYSATKGTRAMQAALNSVFRVKENRSWWKQQLISYGLTFGALILMMLAVFIVIAFPLIVRVLPDELLWTVKGKVEGVRWLTMSAAVFFGLFILFLFGPARKAEYMRSRAIFWGAFLATSLWITTAVGGSIALQLIPQLNAAFGSLGAIICLMMWIYLSAYIVLFGGAITATAENFDRTSYDDTDDDEE